MFNSPSRSEAYNLLRSRTRKAKKLILSYGTILFFVFSAFLIGSLYMMRENIIANSTTAGNDMAQRLDLALKSEFVKKQQFVELIAHYADQFIKDHANDPDGGKAAFDLWMKETKDELQAHQSDFIIDIYASIDGQIVSPSYWDGDPFLIPEARPWYQEAMKAPIGKASILDPYNDIATNTVVTTISARIGQTENVIAVDMYLEKSSQAQSFASLIPENFSFYLVDATGTIILYYDTFSSDYKDVQGFVNSFFESHVKSRKGENTDPIFDPTGAKRNVFTSYNAETGWYTITTTLYSDILFSYHTISNLFLLLVVVFIIIEVWMVWREYHLSSQIETSNEALKVLGNSFQIILRVNFKQGTFTILKAPDLMRLRLATRNSYDDLLSVLSDMVLAETWNNFYKTFSLNHLRNLASLSIRDFGHDYQLKLENDERYKWFNARILFDESLDLDESILCFKLIDEEKITEIEEHKLLADALESAKQNEESKNVFFANMSHDMRTPLNGIIGLCQLGINHMKMGDNSSLPDVFRKMTTASQQLLALVDDILEVARPQMENRQTLAPFDIVKAVEENIDVFKVNAASQGKEVNLFFDVQHNVVIGDAAKLRQILNNLVSNSLKYSNKGCVVNVSIREMLHLHKPSFMIEVSDTGIGMDRKFLSKLFDAYAREHRLHSVQGTGLGMSIVKNVVTIMGGDIKVKSAVDVGTTFTINIPFRLADEATANAFNKSNATIDTQFTKGSACTIECNLNSTVQNALGSASGAIGHNTTQSADHVKEETFRANFHLKGLHILVVEDNELNMEIVCDILQMKGVQVTCAWDGAEAVKVFESTDEYTFDAILMDMRMPNMNGCEASAAIRALGRADSQTIPIIACTANAFTEDIAATQNAGMNAHVSKPVDFTVLENVLAKVIAVRKDLNVLQSRKKANSSEASATDGESGTATDSAAAAAAVSSADSDGSSATGAGKSAAGAAEASAAEVSAASAVGHDATATSSNNAPVAESAPNTAPAVHSNANDSNLADAGSGDGASSSSAVGSAADGGQPSAQGTTLDGHSLNSASADTGSSADLDNALAVSSDSKPIASARASGGMTVHGAIHTDLAKESVLAADYAEIEVKATPEKSAAQSSTSGESISAADKWTQRMADNAANKQASGNRIARFEHSDDTAQSSGESIQSMMAKGATEDTLATADIGWMQAQQANNDVAPAPHASSYEGRFERITSQAGHIGDELIMADNDVAQASEYGATVAKNLANASLTKASEESSSSEAVKSALSNTSTVTSPQSPMHLTSHEAHNDVDLAVAMNGIVKEFTDDTRISGDNINALSHTEVRLSHETSNQSSLHDDVVVEPGLSLRSELPRRIAHDDNEIMTMSDQIKAAARNSGRDFSGINVSAMRSISMVRPALKPNSELAKHKDNK